MHKEREVGYKIHKFQHFPCHAKNTLFKNQSYGTLNQIKATKKILKYTVAIKETLSIFYRNQSIIERAMLPEQSIMIGKLGAESKGQISENIPL
jgi:hypothetical protein